MSNQSFLSSKWINSSNSHNSNPWITEFYWKNLQIMLSISLASHHKVFSGFFSLEKDQCTFLHSTESNISELISLGGFQIYYAYYLYILHRYINFWGHR